MYCLEQTDQPARLDELTVLPGPPPAERAVTLPGIGATIQVTAPGRHASPGPVAPLAAEPAPAAAPAPAAEPAPATAPALPAPATAPAAPASAASPLPPGPDDRAVTLTAIPYFQWDNRGPGAMRVWIPAGPAL